MSVRLGSRLDMILTAFGKTLKERYEPGVPPEKILAEWLTVILLVPPMPDNTDPDNMVSRLIHHEIEMIQTPQGVVFEGRTDTGAALLNSLYQFCRSYDHWQFRRWLHHIQASDF